MKYLELNEETEKQLAQVLDLAFKHSGMAVLPLVDILRSKIKEVPPMPEEKK